MRMHLTDNSAQAYRLGQLKGYDHEYSMRYPMESEFSLAHVGSGIDFDPAVWKPTELQKILIDMVLHEAYVRGNARGTCRQMLYAIRHYNLRLQGYDIFKGKARL